MVEYTKNYTAGYAYMLLCCFMSAVSFVFISHLNQTHDEMLSIFITFCYATLIFNLLNVKHLNTLYRQALRHWFVLLKMNVLTLFNWLSTFMSLRYLDPATALCLNLGVLSVTVFLISTPLNKLRANQHLGWSVLLVLGCLALIVRQYLVLNPGELQHSQFVYGFLWCVCGGISGALIGFSSEAMARCGFTITQILSTRFYLLIMVSAVSLLFFHPEKITIDWRYYLFSSFIIVILPLLCYQAAIRELGVMLAALVEPFSPVLTYLLQVVVSDYEFNLVTMVLLLGSSVAIAWFIRVEQMIQKQRYRP